MGAIIARQPNGRLCRHSSVVDCVTHYNMTEEDYIEMCAEEARERARFNLENKTRQFDVIKELFSPINMSRKEFKSILAEMESEPTEMKTT